MFFTNSVLDFFSPVAGVQVIFKLGFVPQDDEFFELTCEQYQTLLLNPYFLSVPLVEKMNP